MKLRGLFYRLIISLGILLAGCGERQSQAEVLTPVISPAEVPSLTEPPTEEPVTLTVYSQLSSFSGEQQGWFAKILLDKFNVKLNILPDDFDSEEEWNRADIVIFGATGRQYREAVAKKRLLDWEENNLLEEYGSYIQEHMQKALEYNRSLTPESGKIHGFGSGVASSADCAEEFICTWDIRWDLYKELGYPKVTTLEELSEVLTAMKALYPENKQGEETYGLSLWSEWDKEMALYVKSMAGAYFGYDELGMGLYDPVTGRFYDALEKNGPYLQMLSFFNSLYRNGLLDPESANQTYEDAMNKTRRDRVLFSLFNYAGSLTYNDEVHGAENKFMAPLLPETATQVGYGLNVYGGNRVWSISATTKYPEKCMELLNWLCTPEGVMVSNYGPQGLIWEYDSEGNTYFTEFGRLCMEERTTELPKEYAGTAVSSYAEGFPQMNSITWSLNSVNPDSNGERYHQSYWKSNVPDASCAAEQDWREYTGAVTVYDYFCAKPHTMIPATHYEEPKKTDLLKVQWEKVSECIVTGSWNAIYADSEDAFTAIVSSMCAGANACGYEECVLWCEEEAEKRFVSEQKARE